LNTKKYIEEALLDILKKKSIDKIKVSEIIKKVGTCKGTFYKYYCDKYALLQACFKNLFYSKIVSEAPDWETFIFKCLETFEKIPNVILNAFISEDINSIRYYHEKILITYLEAEMEKQSAILKCKINSVSLRLCISSYTEIILNWLRSGMKESKEDVIGFMRAAMPQSIYTKIYVTA